MISNDNIVDIFSYNPSYELFNSFNSVQREEVLKRITLSEIMLHSWSKDMIKIKVVDIVEQAITDNNIDVIERILITLNIWNNTATFVKHCLYKAAKSKEFFAIVKVFTKYCKNDWNVMAASAAIAGDMRVLKTAMKHKITDYNTIAINAAMNGHTEILSVISDKVKNWKAVFSTAAHNGHRNITDMATASKHLHRIAQYAAMNGHKEIVLDMIKKGVNDWNYIAASAAIGGHLDIVEDIYERSNNTITGWVSIAHNAANYSHEDIVRLAISKGKMDWKRLATAAVRGGLIDIVKLAIDNGANNYSLMAENAAQFGHMDTLKLVIDDVNNYCSIAKNAAQSGHIDIVKYMISLGASNFNRIATSTFDSKIVRLAVENGANNWKDIAESIAEYGDKDLIVYLFEKSVAELQDSIKSRSFSTINVDSIVNMKKLNYAIHVDCNKYFGLR